MWCMVASSICHTSHARLGRHPPGRPVISQKAGSDPHTHISHDHIYNPPNDKTRFHSVASAVALEHLSCCHLRPAGGYTTVDRATCATRAGERKTIYTCEQQLALRWTPCIPGRQLCSSPSSWQLECAPQHALKPCPTLHPRIQALADIPSMYGRRKRYSVHLPMLNNNSRSVQVRASVLCSPLGRQAPATALVDHRPKTPNHYCCRPGRVLMPAGCCCPDNHNRSGIWSPLPPPRPPTAVPPPAVARSHAAAPPPASPRSGLWPYVAVGATARRGAAARPCRLTRRGGASARPHRRRLHLRRCLCHCRRRLQGTWHGGR